MVGNTRGEERDVLMAYLTDNRPNDGPCSFKSPIHTPDMGTGRIKETTVADATSALCISHDSTNLINICHNFRCSNCTCSYRYQDY